VTTEVTRVTVAIIMAEALHCGRGPRDLDNVARSLPVPVTVPMNTRNTTTKNTRNTAFRCQLADPGGGGLP
jgi:hypothetical protein